MIMKCDLSNLFPETEFFKKTGRRFEPAPGAGAPGRTRPRPRKIQRSHLYTRLLSDCIACTISKRMTTAYSMTSGWNR